MITNSLSPRSGPLVGLLVVTYWLEAIIPSEEGLAASDIECDEFDKESEGKKKRHLRPQKVTPLRMT